MRKTGTSSEHQTQGAHWAPMPWPAKIGHCGAHYRQKAAQRAAHVEHMAKEDTEITLCPNNFNRYREFMLSKTWHSCSNRPSIHPMSIKAKHSNLQTSSMNLPGLMRHTSLALCGYPNRTHWVSRTIRTLTMQTELLSAVVYLRINMAVFPRPY